MGGSAGGVGVAEAAGPLVVAVGEGLAGPSVLVADAVAVAAARVGVVFAGGSAVFRGVWWSRSLLMAGMRQPGKTQAALRASTLQRCDVVGPRRVMSVWILRNPSGQTPATLAMPLRPMVPGWRSHWSSPTTGAHTRHGPTATRRSSAHDDHADHPRGPVLEMAHARRAPHARRGNWPKPSAQPPDVVLASSMMNVAAFAGATRRTHRRCADRRLLPRKPVCLPALAARPAGSDLSNGQLVECGGGRSCDLQLRVSPGAVLRRGRAFPTSVPRQASRSHGREGPGPVDGAPGRCGSPANRTHQPVRGAGPPLILWNQRWEHDKGPDEFVALIEALAAMGLSTSRLRWSESSSSRLPNRSSASRSFSAIAWSRSASLSDDEYVDLLRRADIVVSTADHEFFGIAIVEAMAAGAFPVLPNRLVLSRNGYRRALSRPMSVRRRCRISSRAFAGRSRTDRKRSRSRQRPGRRRSAKFDWSIVAAEYDKALRALVGS